MLKLSGLVFVTAVLSFSAGNAGLKPGKAELKSASALAFGPDGILFIGDSLGGEIAAIDTGDIMPAAISPEIDIRDIGQKVADLLGIDPGNLLLNDVKVNPISKNIYLAVSRGRGPDAIPVIVRINGSGAIAALSLDDVPHSSAVLPNPPVSNLKAGYRNPRLETITQLAYVDGKVIVAGLSNEEFSSNLRSIPFPFRAVDRGASIEIFHGSHGEYETQAPVRTFIPWTIHGERYIVAAYTCTPLVLISVKALQPGRKVTGKTIAELGMGNRPLDMIPYRKEGHDFILMANSYRGVLKLSAENLDRFEPITQQAQLEGVPFKRIGGLRGVRRLATLDDSKALLIADGERGSVDLRSVPLP